MLSAKKISKRYKNNRRQILSSIDLTLNDREFVAVMGESGSGKSTLLAVLSGILSPDEGQVLLDGKDLYALSDVELAQVHQTKIGYVPQSNIFLKNYTISENVVEPFLTTKGADTEELGEKAQKHLEMLGIATLSDRYPHELSGGELKRAAIARALVTGPDILITDEPTTGLDADTGMIILNYLAEYVKAGHTVLVATHDDHIREYAHKIMAINKTYKR